MQRKNTSEKKNNDKDNASPLIFAGAAASQERSILSIFPVTAALFSPLISFAYFIPRSTGWTSFLYCPWF